MKNFFKLFGIVALAVVIGFSFASCKESGGEGGPDPALNGTWKTVVDENVSLTFFFNNGNYELSVNDVKDTKGTYTAKDGQFKVTKTHKWEDKWVEIASPKTDKGTYSISGNTLTLITIYDDESDTLTLTKQ